MKDIKFRVWDTRPGRIPEKGMNYLNPYDKSNKGRFSGWYLVDDTNWHVMQYTGLKDKNGVEIYEGDILRHASTGEITSVAWHGTMAGFIYRRPKDGEPHPSDYWWGELFRAYAHREVIGNIYENPELFKAAA